MQKAFDDILANNPKAPKLTVQGDELNQIYFPGNFDTPTYGFAAFHQSTYNNLFVEGLSITAGIRLDYEKANLDYHSAVDSMKIGVEMGPMKMTLPVTTTMDGNISQDFLPSIAEGFAPLPVHTRNIHVSLGRQRIQDRRI